MPAKKAATTSKTKTRKVTAKPSQPVKVSKPAKLRKSNKWAILAVIIVFAAIGGFLVNRSFAISNTGLNCSLSTNFWIYDTVLNEGARGDCVKLLQRGLIETKLLPKSAGTDGIFGPKTGDAVQIANKYYLNKDSKRSADVCTLYALHEANKGANDAAAVRAILRRTGLSFCL
jgi:hypothetical protein